VRFSRETRYEGGEVREERAKEAAKEATIETIVTLRETDDRKHDRGRFGSTP